MTQRAPYTGQSPKLVLGIDIGTTFSGVSYVLFEPGQIPKVSSVTRYPGQAVSDSKVPSVLLYERSGRVYAAGAEAVRAVSDGVDEEEDLVKIEWFKLHLRPRSIDTRHVKPLPLLPNKPITSVYADFMTYLMTCTKEYIIQTHPSRGGLWDSVKDDIEYVITHPNGWEGQQQTDLRRAAVEAGLIADTPAGQRTIQFLTEGEASLQFCVYNKVGSSVTYSGEGIVVVDAGGGTIDVSAFASRPDKTFEEISRAQCYFQGSVFVTRRAEEFLHERFSQTRFKNNVKEMVESFDSTTKLLFRDASQKQTIRFGSRETDLSLGIRVGRLSLTGEEVSILFQPSIDAILTAVSAQRKRCHRPISNVFLVGGFAASDFLFSELKAQLEPNGIQITRPSSLQGLHANKPVAEGAVAFYLDRVVSHRVARFDYGVGCNIAYNPSTMSSHASSVYIDDDGSSVAFGYFEPILRKNTQVTETQCFSRDYSQISSKTSELNCCLVEIQRYQGHMDPCPDWLDVDAENFTTHCRITGDLSSVPKPVLSGAGDKQYYSVDYKVNITFGPAEMSAYLTWNDNGVPKSGPAQIIYDD